MAILVFTYSLQYSTKVSLIHRHLNPEVKIVMVLQVVRVMPKMEVPSQYASEEGDGLKSGRRRLQDIFFSFCLR